MKNYYTGKNCLKRKTVCRFNGRGLLRGLYPNAHCKTTECFNFGSCINHYFTSFSDQIFLVVNKIYLLKHF